MSETYSHETLRDAYECGRKDALAAGPSAGASPESTGPLPVVGSGGVVGGLAHTVEKLLRAHELMTRLHGERWPAMSAPWKRIIAAKAAKESISDMAAAVALAKEAPMPAQSLLILAAALEMKTPNKADKPSGTT